MLWSISNWLFPHCPTPSRKAEGIFHGISCRILVKFLEVNLTILWVPTRLHPPRVFTLRLFTLSLQQSVSYGSGFLPKLRFPWWFSPWGSLNFLCSPVSLASLVDGSLSPFTDVRRGLPFLFFFFFNLHSPKLSYPIPWFLFVCLFCFVLFFSQVYRRLTPWFWLSFSSEQPSWLPNFNQGLPAISSHSHFLFFIFLINLMLSCLSI